MYGFCGRWSVEKGLDLITSSEKKRCLVNKSPVESDVNIRGSRSEPGLKYCISILLPLVLGVRNGKN